MSDTDPKPSSRPGFDLRVDTRLLPDGSIADLKLEPGKAHEIVVDVPGGESPGATTPEAGRARAGLALPRVGEKWSTSAPTGSGSLGIGFALPAARGLSPGLGITYSTAGSNGPFGWGWRSSLPDFVRASTRARLRDHGRGVPEYDDIDGDVFIYADAEELVRIGKGPPAETFRARVEGGFARIERHFADGASYFEVRSPDNVVSTFGRTAEGRVSDPNDPARVFRWLLQSQRDDRGNVVVYRYKSEDDTGIELSGPEAPRRDGATEPPQRYLSRILYGNRDADVVLDDPAAFDDEQARRRFMFEVVLDYGEHAPGAAARVDDDADWLARPDPFSDARAGFDVRTRRLCRRVLVFHRFPGLDPSAPDDATAVLVGATDLQYDLDPVASRLTGVVAWGFDGADAARTPTRRFTYTPRTITAKSRTVPASSLHDLDLSDELTDAELLDLDGEGVPGLLTRENGRFVYRAPGATRGSWSEPAPIDFGASPSTDPAKHLQRFVDVDAQGRPSLVEFGPSAATVYPRDPETGAWAAGVQVPAGKTPPVGADAVARRHRIYLGDLDGDGVMDVLVASEGRYAWWRRMGEKPGDGWVEYPVVTHDGDEDAGPGPVLFDAERDLRPEGEREEAEDEAIVLADMTGDGLLDVVRLRADEVAYWPNFGYGTFGRKVVLDAPGLGEPVKSARVRLCDVDGLGPTDILYMGEGGARLWLNECGNRLVAGPSVSVPDVEALGLCCLTRVDGRATASLIFAGKKTSPDLTIVDFLAAPPYLLTRDVNNVGLQTDVRYGLAHDHWWADREAGTPWKTRLPFGVPVVDRVHVADLVAKTKYVSTYAYHHGHYDPAEREFRGFGRVDQIDGEAFADHEGTDSAYQTHDAAHFVAPVRSRTWFHTGANVPGGLRAAYADEYTAYDPDAARLPDPEVGAFSDPDERRDAIRALRGHVLRVETYGDGLDDGDDPAVVQRPLSVAEHGYEVRRVPKTAGETLAVFVVAQQSLVYTYERQDDPDPRLTQSVVVEVDPDYGRVTKSAEVAYPRRRVVAEPTVSGPALPPSGPDAPIVAARVTGLLFEEASCFVRPAARAGLAALVQVYADAEGGSVLVVGHTDREGKTADNDILSRLRARAVAAFVRGDAAAWIALYGDDIDPVVRFGGAQNAAMLAAVGYDGDVVGFQETVDGLVPDGDLGPLTRAALVQRYFDEGLPAGPLPAHLDVIAVGAGEHHPAVATADDVESAPNRRVEMFVFEGDVDPPAPGDLLGPDATEYGAWSSRIVRQIEIDAATAVVVEVDGPGSVEPMPPPPLVDPRATGTPPSDDPQSATKIVLTERSLVHQDEAGVYRIGTVVETKTFEVTGLAGDPRAPLSVGALAGAAGAAEIAFETPATSGPARRLIGRSQQLFYDDALGDEPLPHGEVGERALPHRSRSMAMSADLANTVLGPVRDHGSATLDAILEEGGYESYDGGWWVPSGRARYDAAGFFVAHAAVNPFGQVVARTEHDDDHFLVRTQLSLPNGEGDDRPLRTEYANDYRVLAPRAVHGPNHTTVFYRFDPLGLVVQEVVRGSATAVADPFAERIEKVDEGDTPDHPTRRYAHDLLAFEERGAPVYSEAYVRLVHGGGEHRISLSVDYFDGGGQVVQRKLRTDDGKFRCTGRTVVNNAGLPVLEFGPRVTGSKAYSPGGGALRATMRYDALGRLVRTDLPDGTHTRVTFDAWHTESYDANDTVLDSEWYGKASKGDAAERAAATGAAAHANTPTHARLDVLGRCSAVFTRRRDEDGTLRTEVTRTVVDIQGNATEVFDARGNLAQRSTYDMLGTVLHSISADAGERTTAVAIDGAPLRAADSRGHVWRWTYDALRRPLDDYVASAGGERLLARRLYGDWVDEGGESPVPPGGRHRGRLWRVYDGGGELTIDAYDLHGNPTATTRLPTDLPKHLAKQRAAGGEVYARADWSRIAELTDPTAMHDLAVDEILEEDRVFVQTTTYDALSRPIETTLPYLETVHRQHFTEDGLLEKVERVAANDEVTRVYFAEGFDEYGRPTKTRQGKAATTHHTYDPVTQRLTRLRSTSASGKSLQDLRYTYDPVGNITRIRDAAQPTIHFANAKVEAVNDFRYDAYYRLVEATGREHPGQQDARVGDSMKPVPVASASNPKAMRRYVQRYRYDEVGNLQRLRHEAGAGSFTRHYSYASEGNRLLATGAAHDLTPLAYRHDPHGNLEAMPHLSVLTWDEADRLTHVRKGTQNVWIQYVGTRRVRKLVEHEGGLVEDRHYIGAVEVYEKRNGQTEQSRTVTEHVGGGLQLEHREVVAGKKQASPTELWRHRVSNHLGSTTLELDEAGKVISYEEYHPYGTTAYRATDSTLEVPANRYRFTAMERDEETGLSHHGARYYASWLGRWTSADPIGLADGVNRYAYCRGDPVGLADPGGERPCDPDEMPDIDACTESDTGSGETNYGTNATDAWQAATDPSAMEAYEPYAASGDGRSFGRRHNVGSTGWGPGGPTGPTSGDSITPLYDPVGDSWTVTMSYREAVAGFTDETNPWWARGLFLAGATAMSLDYVAESTVAASLNVPRNADLTYEHWSRAGRQTDPLNAVDDVALGFGYLGEAIFGVVGAAELFGALRGWLGRGTATLEGSRPRPAASSSEGVGVSVAARDKAVKELPRRGRLPRRIAAKRWFQRKFWDARPWKAIQRSRRGRLVEYPWRPHGIKDVTQYSFEHVIQRRGAVAKSFPGLLPFLNAEVNSGLILSTRLNNALQGPLRRGGFYVGIGLGMGASFQAGWQVGLLLTD